MTISIRRWLAALATAIRTAWRIHGRRLRTNPAYRSVLAGLAAALATQPSGPDLAVTVLAGIAALRRALHRDLAREIGPDLKPTHR
ncbi:MAG: hypothetical protein JOY78_09040 [Pseudonocardia sp.]|nr:hypothetical protein [Pseudonocardia sp.]